jgi:hypothetical protein
LHRFVRDLRHARPRALSFSYPISAIPGQTVPEPLGPFVAPGRYSVRLTVDGTRLTQPLTVRMDPRVKTTPAGIQAQHALALRLTAGIDRAADGIARARQLQTAASAAGNDARARELAGVIGGGGRGFGGGGGGASTLTRVSGDLTQLLDIVDGADFAPTSQVRTAAVAALQRLDALLATVK